MISEKLDRIFYFFNVYYSMSKVICCDTVPLNMNYHNFENSFFLWSQVIQLKGNF